MKKTVKISLAVWALLSAAGLAVFSGIDPTELSSHQAGACFLGLCLLLFPLAAVGFGLEVFLLQRRANLSWRFALVAELGAVVVSLVSYGALFFPNNVFDLAYFFLYLATYKRFDALERLIVLIPLIGFCLTVAAFSALTKFVYFKKVWKFDLRQNRFFFLFPSGMWFLAGLILCFPNLIGLVPEAYLNLFPLIFH